MKERDLMLLAVGLLGAVMVASVVYGAWPTTQEEMRTEDVGRSLTRDHPMLLLLTAFLLASAMIGGVYLSKMEGR